MKKLSILYPPTIDYDFLKQRPAQLMRRLALRGHRAFYCNHTQKAQPPQEIEPNLFIVHNFVEFVAGVSPDLYYASNPTHLDLLRRYLPQSRPRIFYDLLDEMPEWSKGVAKAMTEADLVCAVSEPLALKYSAHLLRNGCDPDILKLAETLPPPVEFDVLRKNGKPIVSFIGGVGSWVDTELIEKIDPERYTVIIAGAVLEGGRAPQGRILLGHRPYQDALNYMLHSDILILPFRDDRISHFANPIKMYEYLLTGKTFVAKDSPEVRSIDPACVLIARDDIEFLEGLGRSLEMNRDPRIQQRCRQFALENTWETRCVELERLLEKVDLS